MSAITHDSSSKSKSCWPLIKKTTNFTLIDFFFFLKIFGSSYLHFFFFEGKLPTSKLIRTRTIGSFVSIWYVQVSLAVFAHL